MTGWQRLLLGVALCFPIPALSVSGLELPLPSAVYRVAVALVESTEGVAGVFTGADEETRVLSIRAKTVPIRQQTAQQSRPSVRTGPARASVPVQRAAPSRTRGHGTTRTARSRASQPAAGEPARTPSVPAPEARTEAPTSPARTPPAHAPADEVTKDHLSTDPTPRPVDLTPVPKTSTEAPHPPPPPSPPPPHPSPPSPPPPPPPPPTQVEVPLPLPVSEPVLDLPPKLPESPRLPVAGGLP